jgi:hypothetical protein
MSTTVLDECEINGYGKFTALSNGQIRIAFKDRTCLDMSYDFTRRIQRSLNYSENNVTYPVSRNFYLDKSGLNWFEKYFAIITLFPGNKTY